MKKIAVYGLIGFLLSVTVVGSNWHNHPLNGEETPNCPAYIISIVFASDVPVNALGGLTLNFVHSVKLLSIETVRYYAVFQTVLSNKSPPLI